MVENLVFYYQDIYNSFIWRMFAFGSREAYCTVSSLPSTSVSILQFIYESVCLYVSTCVSSYLSLYMPVALYQKEHMAFVLYELGYFTKYDGIQIGQYLRPEGQQVVLRVCICSTVESSTCLSYTKLLQTKQKFTFWL